MVLKPRWVHRELFTLVCAGVSLTEAARRVGMSRNGAGLAWRRAGGMQLESGGHARGIREPGDHDRRGGRYRPLSHDERVEIMRGRDQGLTQTEIGRRIGRHRSVVCKELKRNSTLEGDYHAGLAHAKAYQAAKRPKRFKLLDNPLCGRIEEWIDDGWSPKLIADMLARSFPDDREQRVSHETIYQCLYVQTRGSLRADLARRLSTHRTARKHRNRVERRGDTYAEAFEIADRPAEAADRAVAGHWEGDLILGAGCGSAIGTLVERTTRFTILLHLPGDHTADTVATAMVAAMKDLPEHLRRTLTWDRGSELAGYERITAELGLPVYFCDPRSPWQRGTNENTNRLLRHWFEKGTDLSVHTPADLRRVQDLLNKRPRPTLDHATPAERLQQLITLAA